MKQFANRLGYSDIEPFEVVKVVGPKLIEVRAMRAEALHKGVADLDFRPGGFVGHCANQDAQRWDIQPDPEAPVVRLRLCEAKPRCGGRRPGFWYDRGGSRYQLAAEPNKFYDYNF